MKIVITESQLKRIISEQQTKNLTIPEQTLLGFLNQFLKGDKNDFQNLPMDELKKNLMFNQKTIYPMIQSLLVKRDTGKKTYDDKTFNALFMTMDKFVPKDQRYEFFKDAENIKNVTYNTQY